MGALALVTALVVPLDGAATARTDCAASDAETFEVTAAPRRDAYRIGQTAVVDLFVTDRISGMPQSDVHAGLMIQGRGKKWPFGAGRTDGEGHAVARVRLTRDAVEPGWAKAVAAAWESIDTVAYCASRYGQSRYPRLFRIRG